MTTSFSVLGPVRAWREGVELDLGPPQQRATLAVLLVRAKRPVAVAEIADVLWGDNPPVSAANVIHRHIGALRRALEPGLSFRAQGHLLVRGHAGYRLAVGPGDVDLTRSRRLREHAQDAARSQDAQEAVARFVEAASLWRGPLVAGIPARARGHRMFTALEDEYVATVREAADTALRHGLAIRVLPVLERCAARRPLDEGVQARLALALSATGHQAEALHVCHAARTRLAEEPGVAEGTELRAAHARVLADHAGGRTLTPPRRAASAPTGVGGPWPRPVPAPRSGPAADGTTHPSPGSPAGGERSVSPGGAVSAAPFVGRRAETAELLTLAADAPSEHESPLLAVVCGQAGVGKSALAAEVARRLAGRFPDGLIRVDLRGFAPTAAPVAPVDAIRGLLPVLGTPPHRLPRDKDDEDAHSALWRSELSGRRALLLLDDARDATQIRPLLPGAPGCATLVTSRDQLLPLVADEGAHRVRLHPLTAAESTDLLTAHRGSGRAVLAAADTARIVERCAGLPFALEAAAAQIADGANTRAWDDAVRAAARQRLHGSCRTLAPAASRLFALLALHPGPGVRTDEAAALAGLPPRTTLPLLAALTGVHLLDEHAPGHFVLHAWERAYAQELVRRTGNGPTREEALHRLSRHTPRQSGTDAPPRPAAPRLHAGPYLSST
ncbi:AfsR/SARP family transcriptional regulator [Streptomyces sp. HM190]|uniref:AfsR/SARP family transcriptional regulator n=1 Tax=Streptomyces sp. HM190 TaxID=2695266 RepID=UPI001358F565|nr:BTAD domain-containing putative transcriptional regulator [Streptomyces sp. HM190]